MKLINADKIINRINAVTKDEGGNIKVFSANDIKKLLNNEPTAYDVDKVAEQLEQKMKRARDKAQENISEYFEGEADGFEFAIEIVKGGGIDDAI